MIYHDRDHDEDLNDHGFDHADGKVHEDHDHGYDQYRDCDHAHDCDGGEMNETDLQS